MARCYNQRETPLRITGMRTILLLILVLLLLGSLPAWPYSSGWGYAPSGGLGLMLILVLFLAFTGRI